MHDILRTSFRLTLLAFSVMAITACDSGPKEPPPDLLKGQRQSMERAKGVEQTLEQSADRRRAEADRAGK
jgi:hypothetical protein